MKQVQNLSAIDAEIISMLTEQIKQNEQILVAAGIDLNQQSLYPYIGRPKTWRKGTPKTDDILDMQNVCQAFGRRQSAIKVLKLLVP